MHALNCHIAQAGDTVYAMIPTYFDPSAFIACKFYVEYAWHSLEHIYYHGIVTELIDDDFKCLKTLGTAQVKVIERSSNQLKLIQLSMPMLFDKERMLSYVQLIQKDYKFDLPGPFVAKDLTSFDILRKEIQDYFTSMLRNVTIDVES